MKSEVSPYTGPEPARPIVDRLVEVGGGEIKAILLFGSQLVRATPSEHSAWDLVVVVDRYAPFHGALVAAGHHRRPAWLLDAMARVLPPNITAFDPGEGAPLAKCAVVSTEHFARALGPRSPDHFLKGRMVQQVELLWRREPEDATWIEHRLAEARMNVLEWAGPFLDSPFTPAGLAHGFLSVSYGGEIRPESKGRVNDVFEAQRPFLTAAYTDVLEVAESLGRVRRLADGRFELVPPAGSAARRRVSLYFAVSKARATLRWFKHIVTFNDWLTYIQRKVERRTGSKIEITPWERRLPLLLLWPKVFRVLTSRGSVPTKHLPDHER
jgi:hypothetical protein